MPTAPRLGVAVVHRTVALAVLGEAGCFVIEPAPEQDAVHLVAQLGLEGRERRADRRVVDRRIEAEDRRLLGQHEGVGGVAEREEPVRLGLHGLADHRRQVGHAHRIALAVHHLDAVLLAGLDERGVQLDAGLLGHVNRRHPPLDLALALESGQHRAEGRRRVVGLGQREEGVRPPLGQLADPQRRRREEDHRVLVLVDDGGDREVHVRAPRGQDEVDLVLKDQALDQLDHLVRLAAVVVLDQLDRDLALVLLEEDAAGVVHVLGPQLVLRPARRLCPRRERPREGNRVADPDRARGRLPARPARQSRHADRRSARLEECPSVHDGRRLLLTVEDVPHPRNFATASTASGFSRCTRCPAPL